MTSLGLKRIGATFLFVIGFGSLISSISQSFNPVPHDAFGRVYVWLDTNGNGVEDNGELPMADVCAWAFTTLEAYSNDQILQKCATSSSYFLTDSNGIWPRPNSGSGFFPGSSCEDVYVYINPPNGFKPTTPLVVNDCDAKFGIAPNDAQSVVVSTQYQDYVNSLSPQRTIRQLKGYLPPILVMVSMVAVSFFLSVILIRPDKVANKSSTPK